MLFFIDDEVEELDFEIADVMEDYEQPVFFTVVLDNICRADSTDLDVDWTSDS